MFIIQQLDSACVHVSRFYLLSSPQCASPDRVRVGVED